MSDYNMEDNFCLIKTNKYKTVDLFLYFTLEYDVLKKAALSLLGNFIGEYSNKYPNKLKMTRAKDNLYGANISCATKAKANLLSFSIKYSFINPKFIKDVTLDDYMSFFKECLFNVYFSNELLFEFKRNLRDTILRSLDKPANLAANRVNQIIAEKDSKFSVYDIDCLKEIESIDLDITKDIYNELFTNCAREVYLVGDVDNDLIDYAKSLKNDKHLYLDNIPVNIDELNEIVEDKDVSQSNLNVVYKTPFNRKHPCFYAYMLSNALLGMVPTSLLFEEVREKLSLCYYISVVDYKNEGLVKIYTAIDGKNKDELIRQIDIQIKRLINKDYDFEKIDAARALLIDSVSSLPDSLDAYIDYLYSNKLNGIKCDIDEYINEVNKVNADDIASVFKEYKHVLTYMLNGVKDEKNI